MPSSTFFNLPEAKRCKLLDAAEAEFRRVPLSKASINRIIKDADISRGSFYMYFDDKLDLFQYLYRLQCRHANDELVELFDACGGDLFAGFLRLFDLLSPAQDDANRPEWFSQIRTYFKNNGGNSMLAAFGLERGAHLQQMQTLVSRLDLSRLRLTNEEAVIVVELLFSNCIWLLGQCHVGLLEPEQARAHFMRTLKLLQCTLRSPVQTEQAE